VRTQKLSQENKYGFTMIGDGLNVTFALLSFFASASRRIFLTSNHGQSCSNSASKGQMNDTYQTGPLEQIAIQELKYLSLAMINIYIYIFIFLKRAKTSSAGGLRRC